MRSSKCTILLTFGLLLVLAFSNPVYSQITITPEDLLGQIGSTQIVLEDQRFSIPIDVGSPGADQVWDFRSQVIEDTLFSVYEFLTPDETGSAGTFPDANMAQRITSIDEPGFEVFNFYNITLDFFINLGDSSRSSSEEFDTSFVFFQNDTIAPLPVAFGNTWITTERDTTGFFPAAATISIDTTVNSIDGWGTIRLPMGDFECLRNKQIVQVINQTIFDGMVFSTTVDSFVQYNWVTSNVFLLAHAQSQNGDTDPDFANAQGFGRLDSLSAGPTSVAYNLKVPAEFKLSQNYPNPFNPETVIRYQTIENGYVELAIFNLLGEKVRVVLNEIQSAGAYEVRWNGTDNNNNPLSSGIYLYRLTSGAFNYTKKMILLR